MRRLRTWTIVSAFVAGAVIVTAVILLNIPVEELDPRKPPPLPEQSGTAVTRAHIMLKRASREYEARLESMTLLRREFVTSDTQQHLVEDELLDEARKLTASHAQLASAADAAAADVARLAAEVSSTAGRAGLSVGPRMSPRLLRSRIRDDRELRRFALELYEFQNAACIKQLLDQAADNEGDAGS